MPHSVPWAVSPALVLLCLGAIGAVGFFEDTRRIYSNVRIVEEVDDVVGFELVIEPAAENATRSGELRIFEGGPCPVIVAIKGSIRNTVLDMKGELTDESVLKLRGKLSLNSFDGVLQIGETKEEIQMVRRSAEFVDVDSTCSDE